MSDQDNVSDKSSGTEKGTAAENAKRSKGSTNGASNGSTNGSAGSTPRWQGSGKGEQSVQNSGTPNEGMQKTERISVAKLEPLAVTVETNLDKAMKILKRKLIKEGLFKELKTRRYFEKPSEKKKRKMKETMKKLRKEEARARKNSMI